MGCPEKEILQANCAAAWDAYADAARESGLSIDPQGHLRAPSISELLAVRGAADLMGATRYATAIRLRGELLKASRELSRHLSRHRC